MKLRKILESTRGKWMEGTGPSSDIVISSRTRLARNLSGHTFPQRANVEQEEQVTSLVQQALSELSDTLELFRLAELDSLERQVLMEKHLISPALARKSSGGAVALRQDEAVSIMVNEEDHLRLQCLVPGLDLEHAWQTVSGLDDALDKRLGYAYDEQLGYLTACPTNVGTGLRASVMMHLPGLVLTGQAARVFATIGKVGMVVRGIYGEGTEALGNLFQISNQVTLGRTEEEIIENLRSVTLQILSHERSARERLLHDWQIKLEDRVARAYGLLTNARTISSEEALQLLSDMRLGIDLNLLGHVSPEVFNRLLVAIRPGFLQLLAGERLDADQRDQKRANLIRERIQASERRT